MKLQPVIIAILTVAVGGVLIYQYEQRLSQGQTMYAKLAPVDPRSLVQGDYMQLGYELSGVDADKIATENDRWRQAWVQIDGDRRIVSADWQASTVHRTPLKLKYNGWQWHPAADSFLFAEGLGDCYAGAVFAKLSVAQDGQAMLVDVVDENLQELGCADRASWWQGGLIDKP